MKEIANITFRLTLSCMIAAAVMGTAFLATDRAKKYNEETNVEGTMLRLLGYDHRPEALKFYEIYRYIIKEDGVKSLGYVIPVVKGYELLLISLEGKYLGIYELNISSDKIQELKERERALDAVLSPKRSSQYADTLIVAKLGDQRLAYLISGEFPGFKTGISIMLALDPTFAILGLEILEHEEDPGLGAEIEEEYFKNQFEGKPFEKVKNLKVIKEPLPEPYRMSLEIKTRQLLSESEFKKIRAEYRDKDIHALTGATISSNAVTSGVRNLVKKTAYRMEILDRVIAEQKVPVAF